MSRRIIKSTNDTNSQQIDVSKMYQSLVDELSNQNKVIIDLQSKIEELENFMKSKQFEMASTPVSKSKSRAKSSPISDPSVPKEKIVKKAQFFKELGNSEFNNYVIDNNSNKENHSHNWQSLFDELNIDVSDVQKFTSSIYKKAIFELCKHHINEYCKIQISFHKKDTTYNCIFTNEDLNEMSVENSETISKSSPKQSKPIKEVEQKEIGVPTIFTNADDFKSKLNFSKLDIFKVDDTDMIEDYKENCEDYKKDTKKESITINKLYKHFIENYKGRKNAPELFVELVNHFESENQKVFVQITKTKDNEVFIYKTLEFSRKQYSDNEEFESDEEEQFSDDE